ncbi:MAG: hypothetical protein R2705_07870 [Ilumatobacteraceae bacterium]
MFERAAARPRSWPEPFGLTRGAGRRRARTGTWRLCWITWPAVRQHSGRARCRRIPAAAWPEPACVEAVVAKLAEPGALERRCSSPMGFFEWSVAEAAAGTAMDQLIHTWDLAVALGADRTLDSDVVDAVAAMFLPHMPEVGRQAGIVGDAVEVDAGASAQDKLLGAMGRDPGR